MKGLLYKEYLHLRNYHFFLALVVLLLYLVIIEWYHPNPSETSWISGGAFIWCLADWAVLIAAYFSFQVDEKEKWNLCALSLPVSKHLLVKSRYLSLSAILIVGNLLGILLAMLSPGFQLDVLFNSFIWDLGSTLILLSALLPAAYRMGAGGSLWVVILVYISLSVIIVMLEKFGFISFIASLPFQASSLLFLVISLALFLSSYFLSCKALDQSDIH